MKQYNRCQNNLTNYYNLKQKNKCEYNKKNTLYSLFEVEHFICDLQKMCKTVNFIKLLK